MKDMKCSICDSHNVYRESGGVWYCSDCGHDVHHESDVERAILNLTQHPATDDQVAAGVIEPRSKGEVKNLLTFAEPPSPERLRDRAEALVEVAESHDADRAMIGGAPFFMRALEEALTEAGVTPVYAFSRRESVEVETDDGIEKRSVFRHVGFVESVGQAPTYEVASVIWEGYSGDTDFWCESFVDLDRARARFAKAAKEDIDPSEVEVGDRVDGGASEVEIREA